MSQLSNYNCKFLDYTVIVKSGRGEEDFVKPCLINDKNCIDALGRYTLEEFSYLCSKAELFIGGDCGPMHIAISEGCRTLTLWGATDPLTRLPINQVDKIHFYLYDKTHKFANNYELDSEPKNHGAIDSITVSQVLKKVDECLSI